MSKTAIITDSTAYLPPSFVKDNEITVIPLICIGMELITAME
jgi:fatty acid-binding protein DegV